jgi:hypothetical protein
MPRGGLQTSLVSMVNMLAASCNGRSSRVTGRTRRNADARISAAMAQGDDEDRRAWFEFGSLAELVGYDRRGRRHEDDLLPPL